MSAVIGIVWGGVVAGAFAVAGLRTYLRDRNRRITRALHDVPATPIADVGDGKVVKIVGQLAYAGRSIESPLSGRTCAYYSIVVEEYLQTGRAGHWNEIIREARGVDFHLRDGEQLAMVRVGQGATFPALVTDHKARTSAIFHDDADLERFVTSRGRSTEGVLFRKNLRASEGILEAGERVAVGGLARWMPDPDAAGGSYRETPRRLVLQASDAMPLFMSDDPAAI